MTKAPVAVVVRKLRLVIVVILAFPFVGVQVGC
jgi:hypothetical protein